MQLSFFRDDSSSDDSPGVTGKRAETGKGAVAGNEAGKNNPANGSEESVPSRGEQIVIKDLMKKDLARVSPIEALNYLYKIQQILKHKGHL
jgi:hypothetical protein